MRNVFLKRRLIRYLNKIYEETGISLTSEDFLKYVNTTKWYRFWYSKIHWRTREDELYRRLENLVSDSIGKYLSYTNTPETALKDPLTGSYINSVNTNLKVNSEGRDFITQTRLELFLKYNARSEKFILTFILSGVFGFGLRSFYNFLANNFNWPIW